MNNIKLSLTLLILTIAVFAHSTAAQTTAFTYQGKLSDGGIQANGSYDLGFALYDAESGGNQIGAALTRPNVNVAGGIFTVQLDFGANAFPGANRFLQIAVKKPSETNFATLTPRQPATSTPYAIKSLNATTADTATTATSAATAINATQLGGVAASDYVQTNSNAFVRNQTAQQAYANFNIAGNGTANILSATQFNSGSNRILFADTGGANAFVGANAGRVNANGSLNFFGGFGAGFSNTDGSSNSFVGAQSGQANTTGNFNAFFGRFTGRSNTGGELNSFFGTESGTANTTGAANSFFGYGAGNANTVGGNNLALGALSNFGGNNLNFASAVGSFAKANTSDTIVIGKVAGNYNGAARPADAVQIPGTLTVAGAITGTVSNASQLGGVAASQYVQTDDARLSDARTPTAGSGNYIQNGTTQQSASNFNISGSGTTGGTLSGNAVNSATQYNLGGSRFLGAPNATSVIVGFSAGNSLAAANTENTFVGASAGTRCQTAINIGDCLGNSFFGRNAGVSLLAGGSNTFIGIDTNNATLAQGGGTGALRGSNNTLIGARSSLYGDNLSYATAIGADTFALESNAIFLGRFSGADRVIAYGSLSAGSISSASSISANGGISARGNISLNDSVLRMRDSGDDNHQIYFATGINGIVFKAYDGFQWRNVRNNRANMFLDTNGNLGIVGDYGSISDARYKTDVQTFAGALGAIRNLRGVTYNWKPEFNNSARQIGFIAQEVEAVLPELVLTNGDGFKSVAYSKVAPVLVEAVKEQQTQIESNRMQIDALQKQIAEQQATIEALKKLVCAGNPAAEICRENK